MPLPLAALAPCCAACGLVNGGVFERREPFESVGETKSGVAPLGGGLTSAGSPAVVVGGVSRLDVSRVTDPGIRRPGKQTDEGQSRM